jgi:hypothetical protein
VLLVQNPVSLSEDSEPQPDLALARPRVDFYKTGHPGPADVLLIVEVEDTSLRFDRDAKSLSMPATRSRSPGSSICT